MKGFSIIVAVDEKMGIGRDNGLVWRLPSDMKHFKEITTAPCAQGLKNVVIMGRKTWESLPPKYRPLPDRINVVITSQEGYVLPDGVMAFPSFEKAIEFFGARKAYGDVFIVGGAQIYAQAIQHPACQTLYVTHVRGDHACDVYFPSIPAEFQLSEKTASLKENNLEFFFCNYQKHRLYF